MGRDILHLTEEGISLAEKINVLISGWVISGGESLTEEEREIFYRCLKKISDNLKTQNDL